MRPLQDQCEPTPYEDLAEMVKHDTGKTIDELFSEFKREPIGVASLAQVHYARLRESGEEVAVKLQHPHLDEFCEIDMKMVEATLGASQPALRRVTNIQLTYRRLGKTLVP